MEHDYYFCWNDPDHHACRAPSLQWMVALCHISFVCHCILYCDGSMAKQEKTNDDIKRVQHIIILFHVCHHGSDPGVLGRGMGYFQSIIAPWARANAFSSVIILINTSYGFILSSIKCDSISLFICPDVTSWVPHTRLPLLFGVCIGGEN